MIRFITKNHFSLKRGYKRSRASPSFKGSCLHNCRQIFLCLFPKRSKFSVLHTQLKKKSIDITSRGLKLHRGLKKYGDIQKWWNITLGEGDNNPLLSRLLGVLKFHPHCLWELKIKPGVEESPQILTGSTIFFSKCDTKITWVAYFKNKPWHTLNFSSHLLRQNLWGQAHTLKSENHWFIEYL